MFKVALINPPVKSNATWVREGRCQQLDIWGAPFPPLSLAYISSFLLSADIKTRIFDSAVRGKNYNHMLRKISEFSPSLVIMATTTPTIESDGRWFSALLKKNIPGIKIAVIGIHLSVLPEETLRDYPFFDFAIMGEPEFTSRELAICLMCKGDLHSVDGIAFRKEREIIKNRRRENVDSLDDLGFPDWTGIDWQDYRLPIVNKPFSLLEFERGCPFSCRFCAAHVYHGKRLRKRSINKMIEEIYAYLERGVNNFLFWAESFTFDREYLKLFLDAIMRERLNEKIRWNCNSRVDNVDRETLLHMKEAGCWQIAFGLEFGNENILRLSKKMGNSSLKQGEQAVCLADEIGIVADGHFMMGFPGESAETMQDTIDYACRLPLTFAHFYSATPFPGSSLYEEAVANKWLKEEDVPKISQSSSVMHIPGLNPETVNSYIMKAYRAFYLRPVSLLRIAKIPKNFFQWYNLCKISFKTLISNLL